MQSTLNFAQTVYDKFVGNPATNIQEVFLFWNMEDRREKTNIYDLYERMLGTLDMKVYTSRIQMRSKFSRELADTDGTVYRSTLFRSDGTFLRESGMAALMDEICTTIGI
jgi:CobQ/CobB/MinD/ParA nucleotide binding domain protein